MDIALFVGSLRKESFNRKVAHVLRDLAPVPLTLEIVEIGQLPLYNQDLESSPPSEWVVLRERVKRASGVLFVTPEYNRSIPGVLKNALDVASRPKPFNAWSGKPGGVVSVTIGPLGAFGANHHLRQCLVTVNVPVLPSEAYIGGVDKLFDASGTLANERTRELLTGYMQAYGDWVGKLAPVPGT